jgi:uncharacterized protein
MLLRFGVKNHLSIRDYQELSCVASAGYDDLNHTLWVEGLRQKEKEFLPVLAVYGANAAGKSNLLDAINFFALAIKRSYFDWGELKSLPHRYFSLDTDSKNSESLYDCDVIIEGIRYQYGFALTSAAILKEWLYAYPKGIRNILFQRDFTESSEADIYFGPSLKKVTDVWKAIAKNRLVLTLSAAGRPENTHDQLTPIFRYFQEHFNSVQIRAEKPELLLADEIEAKNLTNKLSAALKIADFGIVGIELESTPIPDETKKFNLELADLIKARLPGVAFALPERSEDRRIHFRHAGSGGQTYLVGYGDESSGTQYFMQLLVPVIAALETGATLVVDEITTNLHTKLSEKILTLFTSRETNKTGAQFLFSTHDTNLLSRELLRRDEIWFSEKDLEGATIVYPLSDFKTRKSDNIEKGYLQGRFGAIPFLGDIAHLLA